MDGHYPCPRCRHQNPTENRFCGRCGAPLASEGELLVPRRRGGSVTTAAGRALPANLGAVGGALAVGAVALVAEAFLSRLGRRADRGRPSPPAAAPSGTRLVGRGLEEVLVLLDDGHHRGRVFERRAARWFYAVQTTDRRG